VDEVFGTHNATHAGRAFRHIAFTPDWHMGMLLIQSIPSLRALGGEVRLQASDGTLFSPGYLLAHLAYDYEMSREDRLELYKFCLQNVNSPEIQEQILIQLSRDVPYISPRGLLELLNSTVIPSISRPYLMILNELWWRLNVGDQKTIIRLIAQLRERYPESSLADLDPQLRALRQT
jgi:hypothetical protein